MNYNSLLSNFIVLEETFLQNQYGWLVDKLKPGTTALDIGANIGDSAIYLAMQPKIQKIYSYEPYPFLYKHGKKYVDDSTFKKKIVFRNAGVSNVPAYIHIPEKEGDVDSELKDFKHGRKIEVLAINDILGKLKNVIIKCDTEGSEHDIFTAETNLKNVYRMQIEYHHGPRNLPSILKSKGFKVKVKKVTHPESKVGEVGWIFAEKKS